METATFIISLLALLVSGVALYCQFFHRRTLLHLNFRQVENRGRFGIQITITNSGNSSIILSSFGLCHYVETHNGHIIYNPPYDIQPTPAPECLPAGQHVQFTITLKAFDGRLLADPFNKKRPAFIPAINKATGALGYRIACHVAFVDGRGRFIREEIALGTYSMTEENGMLGTSLDLQTERYTVRPRILHKERRNKTQAVSAEPQQQKDGDDTVI